MNWTAQRPKVIFLDAVGTLFGVRQSVGEMYLNVTRRFGVEADPETLDKAFYRSFKSMPFPMAFPGVPIEAIPQKEYEWWEAIAHNTFQQAGIYDQFIDFSAFFAELYRYFASPEPWFIYPDTIPFLNHWYSQGVDLGVLSNFDTRIHAVLKALGLNHYFSSVTISTEVGAAKPDPLIFHTALAKYDCPPEAAWHIGDSFQEDYEGAKAAGIRAIWLKR
jgi:putative hydrolase of the HAD superfamily